MKFRIIILLGLLFTSCVWSASDEECDEKKIGYDLYEKGVNSYLCNVKNYCNGKRGNDEYWDFDGNNEAKKLIEEHDPEKYPDLSSEESLESFEEKAGAGGEEMSFIEKLRKTYEDTQNNIMNCAILRTKHNIHMFLIDEYDISDETKRVLEKANEKIEEKMDEQKCLKSTDENKKETYLEKKLFDSMSYEQCVHDVYLFYYENFLDSHPGDLDLGDAEAVTISQVQQASSIASKEIDDELDLTRRTMSTALKMYEEFDRTYTTHVLLEVIEVELTENKRFLGGAIKIIMQFVKFMNNAQVIETKR